MIQPITSHQSPVTNHQSSGRMDFFNSDIWKEFQRSVAETMDLYIETFDEKGRKIGELCDEPEFCKLIKSSPKGLSRCEKSCCQCFPDALQSGRSFLFICHAGLTSVAVPVTCAQDSSSSADLLRVILLGRVLLSTPEKEKLARMARDFDLPVPELLEAAGVLGKETTSRLKLAGEIIELIVNYLASSSLTLDFLKTRVSQLTELLVMGCEADRDKTPSHSNSPVSSKSPADRTLRGASDENDHAVEGLSTLAEVSRGIGGIRGLDQLLENILNRSKALAKAKRASVMLVEQNQNKIVVKVAKGLPGEVLARLKSVEKGTVAYHVLKQGEPVLVKDITADPRFGRSNLPCLHRQARYESGSFISLPLRLRSRSIGLINVADKIAEEMFDENDLRLLASFAAQATIAIERSLYYEESKRQKLLAVTDELTRLHNRRYFRKRLRYEIERSGRYSHPLCLVMLDVDDFKNYNDNNGHLSGDKVLKRIAQILKATTRGVDIVSRFGGEEFTVIFPETNKQMATVIAERVRKAVEDAFFENQGAQPGGHLTVSLGVAAYPQDAGSSTDLIKKADQAMYQAKVSGKNRAVVYKGN